MRHYQAFLQAQYYLEGLDIAGLELLLGLLYEFEEEELVVGVGNVETALGSVDCQKHNLGKANQHIGLIVLLSDQRPLYAV